MEVQEQRVKDLVAALGREHTAEWLKDSLRDLGKIAKLIEQADDAQGEEACLKALRGHNSKLPDAYAREAIRELCHYPPDQRGPIISAAWCEARKTARLGTKAGQREARYRAALQALDPKSQALLRIVAEVNWCSGYIDADYLNSYYEAAWDWPVDILRSDPAYTDLLALFDMAEIINEANS